MARNIANVDILTDTFNTWVLRTNEVINVIKTEIMTANTTVGVTGSSGTPRNSQLWGSFTANNFFGDSLALGQNFVANTSTVLIGPSIRLIANGSSGGLGQVLTSNSTGVYWSTVSGTGTVTNIAVGNGVNFFTVGGVSTSSISTAGSISIRAGTGIVVNSAGVSVNTTFLGTIFTNALTLQNSTWESPRPIGTTTANTGKFTTVIATRGGDQGGFTIDNDPTFRLSNTVFRTLGVIDVTTPDAGTTGGVRVRANPTSGAAYIQVTAADGSEWGNFKGHSNGLIVWSGAGGFKAEGGSSSEFPAGTKMLFVQATAPVGWTANNSHNDKALRIVSGDSGTGGANGGANGFSIVFGASGITGNTELNIQQMPTHFHGVNPLAADDASGSGYTVVGDFSTVPSDVVLPYNTGIKGGTSSASYLAAFDAGFPGGTAEGFSAGHSHPLNINVAYVDVIIASKDP